MHNFELTFKIQIEGNWRKQVIQKKADDWRTATKEAIHEINTTFRTPDEVLLVGWENLSYRPKYETARKTTDNSRRHDRSFHVRN